MCKYFRADLSAMPHHGLHKLVDMKLISIFGIYGKTANVLAANRRRIQIFERQTEAMENFRCHSIANQIGTRTPSKAFVKIPEKVLAPGYTINRRIPFVFKRLKSHLFLWAEWKLISVKALTYLKVINSILCGQ